MRVCFSAPGATLVGVQVREVAASSHSVWGFPRIRGTLFGGPNNEDYSILGSILGSPYFGKLLYRSCFCFNSSSLRAGMQQLHRELQDESKTLPVELYHNVCEC